MTAPQMASEWSMEQVRDSVNHAISHLRNEPLLFSNHANERSITHRLAVHMEKFFEGWNIDCEYNRIEDDMNEYKRLFIPRSGNGHVSVFDPEGSRVFPDIVVHHRGDNGPDDNLLVIEVKIEWGNRSAKHDLLKLKAFTGRLRVRQLVSYRYGVFLKFDDRGEVIQEEWFERPAQ